MTGRSMALVLAVLVAPGVVIATGVARPQVRPGPPAPTREGERPAGEIRGRVVDAQTGLGLARADVEAIAAAINVIRHAETDPTGAYVLVDLPPGRYRVRASKTTYIAADLEVEPDAGGETTVVAVTAGQQIDAADIQLSRGGILVGRVVDDAGEAVVGARVELMAVVPAGADGAPGTYPSGMAARLTDDHGRYRLFGLPSGTYLVRATAAPLRPPSGRPLLLFEPTYHEKAREPSGARAVVVGESQEIQDVDITLLRAAYER